MLKEQRAQGSTEYLLLIGAVIAVAAIIGLTIKGITAGLGEQVPPEIERTQEAFGG